MILMGAVLVGLRPHQIGTHDQSLLGHSDAMPACGSSRGGGEAARSAAEHHQVVISLGPREGSGS
jgi:hypothetical protein